MTLSLPDLSRFEMECLRLLWARGEASVREMHEDLGRSPSYSTVRTIVERLESKRAICRSRLAGRAWVYRATVRPEGMIRKEIRRFLNHLFDGSAAPLVAHLAEMEALTTDDIRKIEEILEGHARGLRGVGASRTAQRAGRAKGAIGRKEGKGKR